MAAAISSGCDVSDCWNALAVPWKLPRTDTGTPSSAIALPIASVACDSDTPSGRLKLMVEAGVPLWWLIASGVFVVSTRAKAASGTCVARRAGDVQALQRLRALQVFGGELHHHAVLVERVVDHADLALAEGVVQRGVDGAHRHAQARRGVAVDDERGLHALVLLVGVDVGQLRQLRQRIAHARLPGAQIVELVGLQRVLVLRVGLPAADADVLHRHQEQVGARLVGELAAQSRHHRVGRDLALAPAASA